MFSPEHINNPTSEKYFFSDKSYSHEFYEQKKTFVQN
jgi:hypothetical protein